MLENTRPNPARRVKILATCFPRLENEAFRGLNIPASSFSPAREGGIQGLFFVIAFMCFACHSLHLQIFVNKICVHCRMQTLLMPVSYAREH